MGKQSKNPSRGEQLHGLGVSGTIDFFKAKAEKELWGHATVWRKNPDTTAGREGEAKGYTLYHSIWEHLDSEEVGLAITTRGR